MTSRIKKIICEITVNKQKTFLNKKGCVTVNRGEAFETSHLGRHVPLGFAAQT